MTAVQTMSHGFAAVLLFAAGIVWFIGLVLSWLPGPAPRARSYVDVCLFLGLVLVDLWWFWNELARA